SCSGRASAAARARGWSMADGRSRVACVVVTYDALPWIERCLASVAGSQTIVVDNGSSDGTPDAVRERFPRVRVIEERNRGLAAGWNRGIAETDAEHVLVLNADAWLVEDALARLVDAADRHPRAAAAQPGRVAPALRARLPDDVAARDGVPLPPQARAGFARAERVLWRGLRPRERARGGVGDGRLLPPAAQRLRRGRALRRALLPLQRGGRLDAPRHGCGVERAVHADGAVHARRRRRARRAHVPRERPRAPALPVAPRAARRGGDGAEAPARVASRSRPAVPGRARPPLPRGSLVARLGRRRHAAR